MTDTTPAEGTEGRCGRTWSAFGRQFVCRRPAGHEGTGHGCVADLPGDLARPTPPVPAAEDDAVERARAAFANATDGDDPTTWAGTPWWHVYRLLAVVGQQVTAEQRRIDDTPCPKCGGDRLRQDFTGSGRCHAPRPVPSTTTEGES